MSDRVAVMEQGVIVQEGDPLEIYAHPRHRFVAEFVGVANFLDGTLSRVSEDGTAQVTLPGGLALACRWARKGNELRAGERVVVVVRPEDVAVSRRRFDGEVNVFEATVEDVTFLGGHVACRAAARCGTVSAMAHRSQDLHRGERVFLRILPEACEVLRADDLKAS